jgi:hypothetical protein
MRGLAPPIDGTPSRLRYGEIPGRNRSLERLGSASKTAPNFKDLGGLRCEPQRALKVRVKADIQKMRSGGAHHVAL